MSVVNGGFPEKQGLYDPANEKDGCGVGFICDIKGRPSHKIVADAAYMNCCMEHRGGVGYEKNTGDGAGILLGLPHKFLAKVAEKALAAALPAASEFGVGNVFLPNDEQARAHCKSVLEAEIEAAGQKLLGWRELPQAVGIDTGCVWGRELSALCLESGERRSVPADPRDLAR